MADMEVGFNIGVGAEADVGSAKKAVNDLTKGILSSLKDGYIEVPAEVKTSFNKGSKELEKAQKDVIAQWEKMSKKGFSSSEDYLDDLITKYTRFKSLAGKEGKGNSKQSRWLTSNIGELLQPYLDQKRELEKILASSKAKVSSSNKKQYSQSAINKALEQSYNEANRKRNLRTGLKSVVPRGFKRNVGWDTGVATANTVRQSDLSPYGSNYARQMRISELAAVKWMKDSLKVYKNNDLANQFVEDAIKKGNNKNQFTAKSEFSTKAKLASDELAKILGGLEKGKPEATLEEFDKYLESIFNFSNKSGAGSLSGTLLALNRTFGRYFSTSGALGITDGSEKGVGPGHEQAQQALLAMIQKFKKKLDSDLTVKIKENSQVKISPEQLRQLKALAGVDSRAWEKEIDKILYADRTDTANKKSKNTENNLLSREINNNTKATEKQTQYDVIDNSRESAADKKQEDMATSLNEIERTDAEDGGNSATNFASLLSKLDGFTSIFKGMEAILQTITKPSKSDTTTKRKLPTDQLKAMADGLKAAVKPMSQLALPPGKQLLLPPGDNQKTKYGKLVGSLNRSRVETSIKDYSKRFPPNYEKILAASSTEQDRMNADLIKKYGIGVGAGADESGDKVRFARRMSLWKNNNQLDKVFKDFKLTPGIKIDTTEITSAIAKTLSGAEMFKAQSGGWLNNLAIAGTGGLAALFQPSLEKTRAQADVVNSAMAELRNTINTVIQDILNNESALAGKEKEGDVAFDTEGNLLYGTEEAKILVINLQKAKDELASLLADAGMVRDVTVETNGNLGEMVKKLGFTSSDLRKINIQLANVNAGLDKSGKALKFQRRDQEIINYTFQLISRHIGQMLKRLMLMLNPISLIKRVFQDFASYDVKWQRTMNVIKYNIRTILKPFVQWIAQQLVNIIGFVDVISMRVQKIFGVKTPISLFDQTTAAAEKLEEELSDITASFDELHDIGSDDKGANDLLGEIYKPQLSKEWEDLANKIGDVVGNISKYISKNWKKLLDELLRMFLAWQLLKIAGRLLWEALVAKITQSGVTGFFGKIGAWISKGLKWVGTKVWDLLGLTTFGQQMKVGFLQAFQGQGLIGAIKGGGASLGSVFAQAFIGAAGAAIAILSYAGGFHLAANDTSYNLGLKEAGGKDEDKKDSVGAYLLSTLGGAGGGALLGAAIGGPWGAAIGAAIGAIAGIITTSLAPAFEQLEVAARKANNEMQKIEYYEGKVKGYQTEVDGLDEKMNLLNDTLTKQTEKVYKEGEALGISKTRMDELIKSIKDGTYSNSMLTSSEQFLADSLEQLSWQQQRNEEATAKLTAAKRKLEKAELDLAIAQDVEAGNFEMAAARVEYAYASELYNVDEATKKMTQIIKKGSNEQRSEILKDMSPDIKKNWDKYYTTTDSGLKEMYKLYDEMSEEERKAWLQDINPALEKKLTERNQLIKRKVEEANGFLRFLDFNKDGKILGISYISGVPGYATGTNYVPNDGLAYLHQGEAVIPKKYNTPYQQDNSGLVNAIDRLNQQVTQISNKVDQGIGVHGQFVQRGNDLVAVVERANNKLSNNVLNNKVYAR